MNMKAERDVYSVARLNSEARMLLEAGLPASSSIRASLFRRATE